MAGSNPSLIISSKSAIEQPSTSSVKMMFSGRQISSSQLQRHFRAVIVLAALINIHVIKSVAEAQLSSPKLDCHPTIGATKESCEKLGCVWSPVNHQQKHHRQQSNEHHGLPFDMDTTSRLNFGQFVPSKSSVQEPWCYIPDSYVGYRIVEKSGNMVKLARTRPSAMPDDVSDLTVQVQELGSLLRIRITDAQGKRFEPEIPKLNLGRFQYENRLSEFDHEINQYNHLIVRRRSTGAVVFDTDLSKLIFADKFIQLNSRLNTPFVYGLGEHYDTFLKLANSYKAYSFWNTDKVPLPDGRRSYGGFPFYINLEADNKNAHGVYLRNSNGMDIVLQADQSITFRPIGGVLDFFIFGGPTPNDVISQYQHLVGLPDLPPRWALGFHLCRYGYGSLEKTRLVWERTKATGIPFDVQWNDIDNMDRHNDFTYDHNKFNGLPQFVEELHNNNMYYMILFDPGVSAEDNYLPYSLGEQMDIFVKNATNQTLIGKVWNDSGRTVFPDFSNPKSHEYWSQLFDKFQKEIKFDGAWIDMNDISNFVYGSLDGCPMNDKLEQTPYKPGGYDLQTNTLCLSAKHQAGNEYDVHNLYSFYEAIATRKALQTARPGKRPLIISRSTSPGQGHYGSHWSGDVLSNWDYLKWSIPSLIEHSMYGFNLMGSDICGFTGNTNPELCARWSTLGAFYTFTRNHNDDVSMDQDPVALGHEVVEANRNALTKKYSLLPYLYTLIHRAHRFGEPSIKSVPLEFYATDKEALKVEYQFLWGKALMISPVVDPNTYSKSTYLPKGRWYETNVLPTDAPETIKVPKWIDSKGEWYETNNIGLTDIPIFYRGGHIVPIYSNVRQTVAETVKQPIGLEVALCPMKRASGELILDDGDNVDDKHNHLTMKFDTDKLTITLDHDDYSSSVSLGQVKIYGIPYALINGVRANDKPISFKRADHVLVFDLGGAQVTKAAPFVVDIQHTAHIGSSVRS